MELEGLDESGTKIKARFDDFAKDNAQDGEVFAGVGSTPAHARYRKGDQYREVDLRDLASQAGIKQVKFNFDAKMAKEMGILQENIDQGVAYNIERIRSDDGRRKYLTDKGFSGVYNNGDDYYSTSNGYIMALNNADGFDWSDVTRIGAKAGRDLGAAAGALLTGVGAAATGGAALLAAGAAASGGAFAGEMIQRGADKLLGADAAKYNAKLSGAEEITAAGTDAVIGAVSGVGGQLASRALGFAGVKAAQGLNALAVESGSIKASEWTANYAARKEAGYLASTMPGKWLQSAGSAEEAKAMGILKETMQPGKSTEEIKKGVQSAKDAIASGRAKSTNDVVAAEEVFGQDKLRQAYKAKAAQEQMVQEDKAAASKLLEDTKLDREAAFKEDVIQNAQTVFSGSYGEEVEKIFSPMVDANTANKLAAKVEKSFFDTLQKNTNVKIERDASGRAVKVDEQSLIKHTTEKMLEQTEAVGAHADKNAIGAFEFERPPSDREKAFLAGEIKGAIGYIESIAGTMADKEASGILGSLRRLKNAAENHNGVNGDDTGFIFRKFMEETRQFASMDTLPPSVHNKFRQLNDAMFFYAEGSSKRPMALDTAYQAQAKVLDIKDLVRQEIHGQDGGPEFMIKHFNDMARIGGDISGETASQIAGLWHLKMKLDGGDAKSVFNLMNDKNRAQFAAIDAVRNHETLVPKVKVTATEAPAEEGLVFSMAKHGVAAGVAGIAGQIAGPVAAMGAYSATVAGLKKGAMKKAATKVAESAKTGSNAISSAIGNPRVQGILGSKAVREMTGAEEFISKKLQKFTSSSDNRD